MDVNKKNPWTRKGNTLLYKGEDVGMIGYRKEDREVEVDIVSFYHIYTSQDIKDLSDYLWFERLTNISNEKENSRES